MEPTTTTITSLSGLLGGDFILGVIVILLGAVIYLFIRVSKLEKEFRQYLSDQGSRTSGLLERACRLLERIEQKVEQFH